MLVARASHRTMKRSQDYSVYILKCADGSLYTGYAADLKERLGLHNQGKGAKYTRSRLPVRLAYSEECAGKPAAMKREAEIKGFTREEKVDLVRKKGKGKRKKQRA